TATSDGGTQAQSNEDVAIANPSEAVKTTKNESNSPSSTAPTANAERTSSAASAGRDAGRVASAAERAAAADAGYYENAQADDYYYELPTTLSKNLFVRTGRTVYSTTNPIPVSPAMPEGTYYSVQIGAFRNPIPQNLFDEFAPVIGDKLSSGITRYIAGFFMTFDQADDIKMEIRRLGYNDAFVVAYRNGKRVPLYEAMTVTEPDALASMEKEYAYGDGGVAPSQRANDMSGNVNARAEENIATERNATKGTSTPAPSVNGKRTDYYKGVANTVAATQIETVKGLFYTVQIGVYSKPVPATNIKNISPVNSELTANNKIRYTSGIYNNLDAAVNQRNVAKGLGINDAFITAYYNGEKITLSEADRLIKENGTTILVK
ncbi:MAG: SPOR domain-containing protein, partial [Flavobacteriales bacterium]